MSQRLLPDDDSLVVPDLVEQAGEWLLRLSEEDLPPEMLTAWLEWYHADPAHREAFDQLQQEYERLKAVPPDQRRQIAERVLEAPGPRPQPTRAAETTPAAAPPRRRRRLAYAMAASLVVALVAGALRTMPSPTAEAQTGIVQTARGVDEARSLPDGSVLTLGGESAASYRFTQEARYVVLESGEAFFSVAKDRQRPFIVNVGGMTVRAVGTAFNIRRSSERVVVTVTEGIVDVNRDETESPDKSTARTSQPVRVLRLKAGQEVVMSTAAQKGLAVKAADPEAAVAWKSGRLEFVDEPLSAVVATVNRYSMREIVITDRQLARMTMTGSVLKDHIDEWLASLPDIYPAKVAVVGDDTVLISLAAVRETEGAPTAAANR